jgi:hypothetical protein
MAITLKVNKHELTFTAAVMNQQGHRPELKTGTLRILTNAKSLFREASTASIEGQPHNQNYECFVLVWFSQAAISADAYVGYAEKSQPLWKKQKKTSVN